MGGMKVPSPEKRRWHPWGRVWRRTAVKNFLVARISGWRVVAFCLALLALRLGGQAQVFEKVVRVPDSAAGKFPFGKRLLAGDGFSDRTSEIGLSECLPAVSFPP